MSGTTHVNFFLNLSTLSLGFGAWLAEFDLQENFTTTVPKFEDFYRQIDLLHRLLPGLRIIFLTPPTLGLKLPHYKLEHSRSLRESFQKYSKFVTILDVAHMTVADVRGQWSDAIHVGPCCKGCDHTGRPIIKNVLNMLANVFCGLHKVG